MRRRTSAMAIAALLALATCGCGRDHASTSAGATSGELSTVASDFGEAYIRGDMDAVVAMLTPADRASIPDQLQSSFRQATEASRDVELRDFSVSVHPSGADTATATYRGKRCSPTDATTMTTLGSGNVSDSEGPATTEPAASETAVETHCLDIAEQATALAPFSFHKVDGRWYPRLPELR